MGIPVKISFFLKAAITCVLLTLISCYTQFAKFETRPSEKVITVLDASGNLVGEVRQNDTIETRQGEICVWEQDGNGYPYLRCYPRHYPRSWYGYNKSPWWYRSDEHLYSAERCPAYYYFDEHCGCCRYYLNNPELTREKAVAVKTPVSVTGQARAQSPDTNVRVSATTYYQAKIQPKTVYNDTRPAVSAGTSGATTQASLPAAADSAKIVERPKDSSADTATLRAVYGPGYDSVSSPQQVRPRRTMRSR